VTNAGRHFVKVVVGGVVGALLYAAPVGAQPFPGGLPAVVKELNACTSSLTQTQGQLGACQSSLGTCHADLVVCEAQPVCGDGSVGAGEQCDVGNLNGKTCKTQGFAGGTLACGTGCRFDTSGCYAQRFVDNGDGTITDHETKLMWEKKSQDASIHYLDSLQSWNNGVALLFPEPNGTAFTVFLGVLNSCAVDHSGALTGGFAGHCDWRLPTLPELLTIVDTSRFPTVPAIFDTNCTLDCTVTSCSCTAANYYWSNTTSPGGVLEEAGGVHFDDGQEGFHLKTEFQRVRAVRSVR